MLARRIAERLGLDTGKRLVISKAIPAHAGLGSGTQLALAIATAFRKFAAIAARRARGCAPARSRRAFGRGCCLVRARRPGGRRRPGAGHRDPAGGRVSELPSGLARSSDPGPARRGRAWRGGEREAFAGAAAFPRRRGGRNLPPHAHANPSRALRNRDLEAFGDGVARVQEIVGDHFAPAQGGGRFTSAAVGRVAERLKALGAHGIGQSSWGPTGFAFASDPDHAEFLARRAARRARIGGRHHESASARDHGAEICEEEDVSIP